MNTLITIPFSHYCEKARWALERCGVPFVERAHLPLLHMIPKWRVGGRTLPVLVRPGAAALLDSTDIVRFADTQAPPDKRLFADDEVRARAEALEDELDETLGPAVRLWGYHWSFTHPIVMREVIAPSLPSLQRRVLPWLLPLARPLITRRYGVSEPRMRAAMRTIEESFAAVGERLGGRPFLVGESFSAADLTFAALAAAVVMPERHRSFSAPASVQLPAEMLGFVERMRDTAAGRHVLRIYREYR